MRMSRFLLLCSLAIAGGCSTISGWFGSSPAPVAVPAPLVDFKPSTDLRVVWTSSAGAAGAFDFDPAVLGDAVFVAAADGRVARLDAQSGREVWRVDTGKKLSAGVGAGPDLIAVGTAKGEVLAFDAAGKPRWTAQVSSEVLVPPAVAGDVVAVRSQDGRVVGLDVADGKRKWVLARQLPALSVRSHAGIAVAADTFFTGFPGGRLVAISPKNGAVLWEAPVALPRGATELERIADVTGTPVADAGMICAAAFQGRVACFDVRNGNLVWARDLSSTVAVAMDEAKLYVADEKGNVVAYNKRSGAGVWRQEKLSNRRLSAPLAIGRHVVVADFQGHVHLLSVDDGAFAARGTSDGSAVRVPPVPVAGGFLVQTSNGGVYAFKTKD